MFQRVTFVTLAAMVALAAPAMAETLYFSDGQTTPSTLHRVTFDDATFSAQVVPLTVFPEGNFTQVDALAVRPDDSFLIGIDKPTASIAKCSASGCVDTGLIVHLAAGGPFAAAAPDPIPGIVLAGFSPGGTLYIASEQTDELYTVDLATGQATSQGRIKVDGENRAVDLLGADLAFTACGDLFLWTNCSPTADKPELCGAGEPGGLYKVDLSHSFPLASWQGQHTTHYFNGLAFRGNGDGHMVGSIFRGFRGASYTPHFHDLFMLDPSETYVRYEPDAEFGSGDMASPFVNAGDECGCTFTIGWYKNHSWEDELTTVCGDLVDEEFGQSVMWGASARDTSMLAAQLIAAKLNVNSAPGTAVIDEAEAFLCATVDGQPVFNPWYMDDFGGDRQLKDEYSTHVDAVSAFNQSSPCDDNGNGGPPFGQGPRGNGPAK